MGQIVSVHGRIFEFSTEARVVAWFLFRRIVTSGTPPLSFIIL